MLEEKQAKAAIRFGAPTPRLLYFTPEQPRLRYCFDSDAADAEPTPCECACACGTSIPDGTAPCGAEKHTHKEKEACAVAGAVSAAANLRASSQHAPRA